MLRTLVGIFLIFVIVEGAVRKWVLPEYEMQVFVVKDVLLACALATYALQRQRNVVQTGDVVLWYLWVLLVLGFAVTSGFSIETLVGLRYYLAPIPLIVLVPALITDASDLERLAAWTVRLSLPIGILAIIQYLSPLDSSINIYAWSSDETVSSFGVESEDFGVRRARVTSTFSYISTFAAFLSAAWILAWMSLLHGRSQIDRWLAVLALILIAFNMGMNGSRALLVIAGLTGLPFAITLIKELINIRTQLLVACLASVVGYFGVAVLEPFALTAERGGAEEGIARIIGILGTPFATLSEISWGGAGMGGTFGGYEQLGFSSSAGFDEINLDRVGIELGAVAYLFVLFAKMAMLVKAVVVYRRAPTQFLRHWGMAALLVQISTNWQIPFYNSIAATYYFCAIGLVYWLERESNRRRELWLAASKLSTQQGPMAGSRSRGW